MNKLKARLKSGKACVNAWLAIPSGFSAEVMAQCGWDSVKMADELRQSGSAGEVRPRALAARFDAARAEQLKRATS